MANVFAQNEHSVESPMIKLSGDSSFFSNFFSNLGNDGLGIDGFGIDGLGNFGGVGDCFCSRTVDCPIADGVPIDVPLLNDGDNESDFPD